MSSLVQNHYRKYASWFLQLETRIEIFVNIRIDFLPAFSDISAIIFDS